MQRFVKREELLSLPVPSWLLFVVFPAIFQINMAKFARAVMDKMPSLTRKLEIVLGPGTADLQLRIGTFAEIDSRSPF